jgi:hypothetical protein
LQRASHSLAEALYKGSHSSAQTHSGSDSTVKDGEVVDAEFAETR